MTDSAVYATVSEEEIRKRVAALQSLAVLDTPPEEGFDALTRAAAEAVDAPIAIVSLIDGDRLWFKSAHGVEARTIPSAHSFCGECANSGRALQVTNARADTRFASIGLVTGPLGIQFYAGAPILYGGAAVGTLCVLDNVPRELPLHALRALQELARVASALLRARAEAFRLFAESKL